MRYDKNASACLHGLANGDAEQQQQCPLTNYKTRSSPQLICILHLNKYITETEAVYYHFRCPDMRPQADTLTAGAYVIDIPPKYVLDSPVWMLCGLSISQQYVNFNFSSTLPISIEWLKN